MVESVLDEILATQRNLASQPAKLLPVHKPKMLYIGCVDARVNPDTLGMPHGTALIYRNIGALVRPEDAIAIREYQPIEKDAVLAAGEVAENVSLGAVLEFYINHLPHVDGMPKHIAIGGHTHCGGLNACLGGLKEGRYLPAYLDNFADVRDRVLRELPLVGEPDESRRAQQLQALVEASVVQSLENLQTYRVVKQAMSEGRLHVHGWVIDTANALINRYNPAREGFEPLHALLSFEPVVKSAEPHVEPLRHVANG